MSALHLRVRVSAGGKTRADLTFPAAATANLSHLVPPDVAGQLAARGIDPAGVAERAVAAGFPAGELFALETGEKSVRVWLE